MFRLGRLVAATSRYVISIIISKHQCLSLTSSSSLINHFYHYNYHIFSIEEQMLGIWAVMDMVMDMEVIDDKQFYYYHHHYHYYRN